MVTLKWNAFSHAIDAIDGLYFDSPIVNIQVSF